MSWKCFLGLVLMCFLWNRTHNNGIHELDKSPNTSSSFCLLRLFSRCCIFGTDLHSPEHSYWQVVRGLMCWNVFRKTANSGPSLLRRDGQSLIGWEWSRDLDTGLWLAENDHVTWILASDWSSLLSPAWCGAGNDRTMAEIPPVTSVDTNWGISSIVPGLISTNIDFPGFNKLVTSPPLLPCNAADQSSDYWLALVSSYSTS